MRPGLMALAAHNMALAGSGPRSGAGGVPAGITRMKSGSLELGFTDAAANARAAGASRIDALRAGIFQALLAQPRRAADRSLPGIPPDGVYPGVWRGVMGLLDGGLAASSRGAFELLPRRHALPARRRPMTARAAARQRLRPGSGQGPGRRGDAGDAVGRGLRRDRPAHPRAGAAASRSDRHRLRDRRWRDRWGSRASQDPAAPITSCAGGRPMPKITGRERAQAHLNGLAGAEVVSASARRCSPVAS
jgi:hypothetical protein